MRVAFIALLGLMASVASAIELTDMDYDYHAEGKSALIKFYDSGPE
jgi:hypothetical protein